MRNLNLLLVALLAVSCVGLGTLSGADLPAHDSRPKLFLVGDSTVRNGSGQGSDGLWGWGSFLPGHFDPAKIRVENRAIGGRSSRTFITEGRWKTVTAELNPGDFVIIQFGHNDGGEIARGDRPRASLKGFGDESQEVTIEKTGQKETVRTYGWYLRKYISDAKALGATPIVCSLVPRNIWRDGKVVRAANDYAMWAARAAKQGGASFIDLNELLAKAYEEHGQRHVVGKFFTPTDHTHTTRAGAEENADVLARAIRELNDCTLKDFLVTPVQAAASPN